MDPPTTEPKLGRVDGWVHRLDAVDGVQPALGNKRVAVLEVFWVTMNRPVVYCDQTL